MKSRKFGWSPGDTIQEVNGEEATNEEFLVNAVKNAKKEDSST